MISAMTARGTGWFLNPRTLRRDWTSSSKSISPSSPPAIVGQMAITYADAVPEEKTPKDAAMPAPLDPVVAQIIPLLPLRDPTTMTPQSARDALRALAASRAAVPPPPVAAVGDTRVRGGPGPRPAGAY